MSAKRIVLTGDLSNELLSMLKSAGLAQESIGENPAFTVTSIRLPSGLQADIQVEPDWERATDALNDTDSARAILFYEAPRKRIAEAIARGESLETAISDYKDYASSILRHYRRHRRELAMLDSWAALSDPILAIKTIEKHTSVRCKNLASPPDGSLAVKADGVDNMIAISAVHEDYDLKLLVRELEAGSAMLPQTEARSLSQRLVELRAEIDVTAGKTETVEIENKLLLLQLHQVHDELENYFTRVRETEDSVQILEGELQATKKHCDAMRMQVAQFETSTSWKITAPLRWLSGLVAGLKD